MKLVIAEKPSVAKSIAAVIGADNSNDGFVEGNGFIVSWCVGHLVELYTPQDYDERYQKYSFETLPIIPPDFKMKVLPSTEKQYRILKKLMLRSDVEEIICATDAGREGECIFRYVYDMTGCRKPVKRLWISSVEDNAIRNGMNNLHSDSDFDNMYKAGFARNKADWLVGMNFSRVFSCRYGSSLSVGRVQTPTLAMIVNRDFEVKNLIKQKFFTVELDCGSLVVSSARIDDENAAVSLAGKCNGNPAVVKNIDRQTKKVNPPKLYDLTTLQREANRQYGYTAQQTLDYTQSLYESKLVTYPRTDSQYLTEDMEKTALDMIENIYSVFSDFKPNTDYEPNVKRLINNDKVSDHHAIIPTAEIVNKNIDDLPDGEKNILLLIAAKLVTAAAPVHSYESVKVTVIGENTEFTAIGKTIIENGFKAVEKQIKIRFKGNGDVSEDKEKSLPKVSEGQRFDSVNARTAEHFTSPPKPYTEDTLLSSMETAGNSEYDNTSDVEKKGLGTPATRAGIIEGLVKRGFIERNKKQITATEKGVNLINVLPDTVKSAKLTADWEIRLQAIEKGSERAEDFMTDIENYVRQTVSEYSQAAGNTALNQNRIPVGLCPKCGKKVLHGKYGYYCSGKCGMQVSKVYGKELTESQLKKLLSGDSVTYTNNGKSTTVLPEIEPYSYNGKSGFQWKVKRK